MTSAEVLELGLINLGAVPILSAEVVASLRDLMPDEPTFFSELVGDFERAGSESVALMRRALEEGNADALHRAAHTFKGASGAIGAQRVARLAALLQTRASEGNLHLAGALLDESDKEFATACEMLRRETG